MKAAKGGFAKKVAMKRAKAMRAMRAMKTMKAMKAMKIMKRKKRVSKIARGKLAKSRVLRGLKEKTSGGLRADALMRNKQGKVVSKRASANGKRAFKYVEQWVEAHQTGGAGAETIAEGAGAGVVAEDSSGIIVAGSA